MSTGDHFPSNYRNTQAINENVMRAVKEYKP